MPPENRWSILVALSLAIVFLAPGPHARADNFDIARGQRMLSAALASSAIEHSAGEDVTTPRTPDQQMLMFLISPRYNAYLWAHPETLPHVVDRAAEPGFLIAAYQATWRPDAYLHFLNGWMDIEKLRTYFELIDPHVMVTWADPRIWITIPARLADQGRIARWTHFAMGGRLPELVEPALSADTYAAWLMLPFDARSATRLREPLRVVNPVQPLIMADAIMDSGMRALRRFAEPDIGEGDP